MNPFASRQCLSQPMASQIRSSVSESRTEPAPCLVALPVSSLSALNHRFRESSRASAPRKPLSVPYRHIRLSIRGAEKNSFAAPHTLPGIRL